MELNNYVAPERTEGDSFKPSENIGNVVIVKVIERKQIDSTVHKPEGGPAIIAHVCDLTKSGQVFRDIMWMNDAVVTGLTNYVGQTVCGKFAWAKSGKSGRDYIVFDSATPDELAQAQAHVSKGDPFAEQVVTPAPATTAAPPF